MPVETQGSLTIAPNDSTDLTTHIRRLWVGGAGSGNLKFTMVDGSVTVLAGVTVGVHDFGQIARIWATGTDVTNMVGFF